MPIFREVQRFRQWWIWLIIGFSTLLMWYFFMTQIVLNKPIGGEPAPNWFIISFWLFFGLAFPYFFWIVKLIVEVRTDELLIHLFPLRKRVIPLSQIQSFEAQKYNPILDYGGWGWRQGWGGKGVAFNVRGNRGVFLVLESGEKIMVGSQKADELAAAIASVKKS